jgi:hypothetical protein
MKPSQSLPKELGIKLEPKAFPNTPKTTLEMGQLKNK